MFQDPTPPQSIDLRCCDVAELLPTVRGATLVVVDAPWSEYDQRPGAAAPDLSYPVLSMDEIVGHIDLACSSAAQRARMLLWCTWPLLLNEWADASKRLAGWRYVTGGSWHKDVPQPGVGYHWLGHSEPALVYAKKQDDGFATFNDRSIQLRNAFSTDKRLPHSEKPIPWQRLMLRRWTKPGDLVLDLYAGRGSVARACLAEGRRYVGAEIDVERHGEGVKLLTGRVGI